MVRVCGVAFAGIGSSFTIHLPSAPACAGLRLPGERHGHLRARGVPTPDRIRLLLLQHHVVADDRREAEIGSSGGKQADGEKEEGDEGLHQKGGRGGIGLFRQTHNLVERRKLSPS